MAEPHYRDEMPLKHGKDDALEGQANELLAEGVGENKRSVERDAEKIAYEAGRLSLGDLRHYDPLNDWDTLDSAYTIFVPPADVGDIESTLCADDDNVRARNPALQKRNDLRRHVEDADSWGATQEDIPFLGDNGDRKRCSKCARSKSLDYFSPDPRGRRGRDNWCKVCRMGQKRNDRAGKPGG